MKKLLASLLLLAALLHADETDITLGAGPYLQTQPYEGADALIVPSPVIFFDNQLFYIRWTRFGMYFMGESSEQFSWGASVTAQPRPFGYSSDDSSLLEGMDDRKTSWEGGLSLAAKYHEYFAEFLLVHDLRNNSNGSMARVELGANLKAGKFSFYPSALLIYRSKNFNNYYYGVKANEATTTRPAYNAGAGMDFALQSYIKYDITKQWHALVNLRADYLSNKAVNSPIVNDRHMLSGLISLMYSFTLFSDN